MKYLVGNWKMHTTVPQAVTLAGKLEDAVEDLGRGGRDVPEVVICPPFPALTAVSDVLAGRTIQLGAQDCHWEDSGPYTGEVSPVMLADLAKFVIIGHSERRRAGERSETIAKKVAAAARHGLAPILCVGETAPDDVATQHAEDELRDGLAELDAESKHHLVVAYEPVWAVGTGNAADANHIREVAAHLRSVLAELDHAPASLLYGGSVTRDNAAQFTEIAELDGLLVGGASLDAAEFQGVAEAMAAA